MHLSILTTGPFQPRNVNFCCEHNVTTIGVTHESLSLIPKRLIQQMDTIRQLTVFELAMPSNLRHQKTLLGLAGKTGLNYGEYFVHCHFKLDVRPQT